MTAAVIIDHGEYVSTLLIDVPDGSQEEKILEAIAEELEEDVEDLELQWFEIEPSAVERLKAVEWPDPYEVDPIFADAVGDEVSMSQALVYAAFAKDGPVKLDAMED